MTRSLTYRCYCGICAWEGQRTLHRMHYLCPRCAGNTVKRIDKGSVQERKLQGEFRRALVHVAGLTDVPLEGFDVVE